MDWAQILSIFVIMATNLGTIVSLYMNLDKKLDENRKETNALLQGIQTEIKDFHGRLCAIEERNKK